jgi:hypothetical protein
VKSSSYDYPEKCLWISISAALNVLVLESVHPKLLSFIHLVYFLFGPKLPLAFCPASIACLTLFKQIIHKWKNGFQGLVNLIDIPTGSSPDPGLTRL